MNRIMHVLLVGPVELMHDAMMSASVFTVVDGMLALAGSESPGERPVPNEASSGTSLKAFRMPTALVAGEPIATPLAAKGASGHTAATVDTSLISMNVDVLRLPQGPMAAIKLIALLVPPPGLPGLPPVAVT